MARAKKKTTNTLVWILMGMLILGLGGFGATNFSGNVRSLGTVGETEIPVSDYMRALQGEIRAVEAQAGQAVTFQQAQALGLPQRVLAQMVEKAALENEAAQMGISVGDARLAEDLRNVRAFQGPDGQFSRETYKLVLENADLTEAQFEEQLRAESAATLLQGAVLAGVTLPDTYVDTIIAYTGERRAFTWTEIGPERLTTGLPTPDEAELQAFYEDNIDRFTRPETRQITYAWLTPEMLVQTVEVDEAALRAAYEEREAEFNMPERRLVERLVFGSQEAAQAAADRLAAGEATFEQLVAERDLQLSDVDLGDVTRDDLGSAAEAVFAVDTGEVAGPADSSIGPALFRVNAVLAAQETPFEEAIPALRDDLALDRARRLIETQAQGFDDELAGGVTLEELAETTDMELGTIGWTGESDETIAGFDAFREAAGRVTADDYPAIEQLGDGGIFALRLDEVQAPAPYPFDEVRDQVQALWDQQATTEALTAEAQTLADQLSEGATFEGLTLAPNTQDGLTRTAYGAALPSGVLEAVFDMEPGDITVVPGQGRVTIVRLDEILPAEMDSDAARQLAEALKGQAAGDVANDLYRALSTDIQQRAGLQIDQQVVNAVHANFQ